MDEKIPLIVVAGPTASGKTKLAVDLARKYKGEVISADSMQIYKKMNIGTAKPTAEEMDGIPHYMLDFLDPSETFNVADYVYMASECIRQVFASGHQPILAGGTGLYINTLIDNITFLPVPNDPAVRLQLEQQARREGIAALYRQLQEIDPEICKKIHPNNKIRVIRALEIYQLTGKNMSWNQAQSRNTPSPNAPIMIGLRFSKSELLYQRINQRVDKMLKQGLVEECKELYTNKLSVTARQAIGYKEIKQYLDGQCSLEEAVEQIKQGSRNYAKRQLTWFRRDNRYQWFSVDGCEKEEDYLPLLKKVQNFIEQQQKL